MRGMNIDPTTLLRERKLKVTPARIAILGAFSAQCEPMSAEAVGKKLKRKEINLVTIYRTLESFEKAGILSRVDLHQDSVHYELRGHHHHHIVCTNCGRIGEFEACGVAEFVRDVLKHSSAFKRVDQHSLELFGICTACVKA